MSDFMRPYRFPRTDGDVLAIEEIAPAPFLVHRDPGAVESVAFPVRAGETIEPEAPGWAASNSTEPAAPNTTADVSLGPADEGDPADATEGGSSVPSSDPEPQDPEAAVRSTLTAELEDAKEEFAKAAANLAVARRDLLAGVQEDLIDLAVEDRSRAGGGRDRTGRQRSPNARSLRARSAWKHRFGSAARIGCGARRPRNRAG